ncbi:MAG: hypothetical protein HQ463_05450 [Bacteroidetes bacterium]|nr:hypothetical protein [Bacteroidota bacterium]
MNQAHLHLLFNHLPIIIPFIGLMVLLSGIFLKSDIVQRTAYCILIAGALCTIPAFFTGEGAEEIAEELGINHKIIHEHEETAELFAIISYLMGTFSIFSLWLNWKKSKYSFYFNYLLIAFILVTLFFAQKTGTSGGEIRHTEIGAQTTIDTQNINQNKED